MYVHLRASLVLVVLSMLICSVLYPLVLLGIGQGLLSAQANGSIVDVDGKPAGSRLIAQGFSADHYFWSRPSAVSYNAAAAGGSNWGANNPKLRDRVARQLGPIVRYTDGRPVGPEVGDPATFDAWLQSHPNIKLAPVPADMVMASGSGLDPHISIRNARYQLERVVAARAATAGDQTRVRQRVEAILQAAAFLPLGGLAGGDALLNVLETNLALDRELPRPAR